MTICAAQRVFAVTLSMTFLCPLVFLSWAPAGVASQSRLLHFLTDDPTTVRCTNQRM